MLKQIKPTGFTLSGVIKTNPCKCDICDNTHNKTEELYCGGCGSDYTVCKDCIDLKFKGASKDLWGLKCSICKNDYCYKCGFICYKCKQECCHHCVLYQTTAAKDYITFCKKCTKKKLNKL